MALTRKFLAALGIDDAKIDEIISAHTDTVNGLKEQIDKYKADAQKLAEVQQELDDAKKAMENGEKSPYKVKYEAKAEELDALKKEFDDYKAEVAAKEVTAKKTEVYRQLLKETGVSEKRIDAILKVTDINAIELDGEKAKDPKALTEAIKAEWADFIVTEKEQGASTSTPPRNNGGQTFDKMSLSEKMTYANEHPDNAEVVAWLKKE